jgi:hypothetical protein
MSVEQSTSPPPEKRFLYNSTVIIDIVCEIIDLLEKEGKKSPISKHILVLGKTLMSKQDPTKAIKVFICKTSQHWESIREKNNTFLEQYILDILVQDSSTAEKYLKGVPELFSMVTNEENLKTLKCGKDIRELNDEMWDTIQSCVKISINYVHIERKPIIESVEGEDGELVEKSKYTEIFFPSLAVKKLKEIWEMK